MADDFQNKIRYHINRFIFDNGFAPCVGELVKLTQTDTKKVELGLKALSDNNALVLHPKSFDIWVAHPFALFPTLFWVKSAGKQWWGNCAWCSFGIATLINADAEIFTKLQGQQEPLTIHIKDNKVVEEDFVVHFPIPASKFWDNVIYTCSMMLIFKDENEVREWCKRHNKPKGQVLQIRQVWELSKLWYGNYLCKDFKRKTKQEAEEIFRQIGLTSDFWKL